jgi:phosphoribosylglycinamide formyltransferase-1
MKATQIAIFASGAGSNAKRIIAYFRNHSAVDVALIITNNASAGAIEIAKETKTPCVIMDNTAFVVGDDLLKVLHEHRINWIILAGFLRKIPSKLIKEYQNRIINIHPSLLPKYGGKGMYGDYVHQAVLSAGEKQTGISIHYVTAQYDEGALIAQFFISLTPSESVDSIRRKVQHLEQTYFPLVIEQVIANKKAELC